jgi:hypothetical protein
MPPLALYPQSRPRFALTSWRSDYERARAGPTSRARSRSRSAYPRSRRRSSPTAPRPRPQTHVPLLRAVLRSPPYSRARGQRDARQANASSTAYRQPAVGAAGTYHLLAPPLQVALSRGPLAGPQRPRGSDSATAHRHHHFNARAHAPLSPNVHQRAHDNVFQPEPPTPRQGPCPVTGKPARPPLSAQPTANTVGLPLLGSYTSTRDNYPRSHANLHTTQASVIDSGTAATSHAWAGGLRTHKNSRRLGPPSYQVYERWGTPGEGSPAEAWDAERRKSQSCFICDQRKKIRPDHASLLAGSADRAGAGHGFFRSRRSSASVALGPVRPGLGCPHESSRLGRAIVRRGAVSPGWVRAHAGWLDERGAPHQCLSRVRSANEWAACASPGRRQLGYVTRRTAGAGRSVTGPRRHSPARKVASVARRPRDRKGRDSLLLRVCSIAPITPGASRLVLLLSEISALTAAVVDRSAFGAPFFSPAGAAISAHRFRLRCFELSRTAQRRGHSSATELGVRLDVTGS